VAEINAKAAERHGMLRGRQIYHDGREWRYADNNASTAATYQSRTCGTCDTHYTQEGHDGCLGALVGVMNACCGHGDEAAAYVQFCDGSVVRGKNAAAELQRLAGLRKATKARPWGGEVRCRG